MKDLLEVKSQTKSPVTGEVRPTDSIVQLLDRPVSERLREYKYRFAQSTVFGLPVLALHFAGPSLGGPEAGRWTGLLQLLLAGWVMYVGALAMLVEGMMRRRMTGDAAIAGAALAMYLVSAAGVVHLFISGRSSGWQGLFPWAVGIVMAWTAGQWTRYSRRLPATC